MFIAAKCPACGGDLEVPEEKDFVECEYCGTDVKVREVINVKVENNLPQLLKLASYSASAGNYNEAYYYYSNALELEAKNSEAWLGKAEALTHIAAFQNLLEPNEILSYFKNALDNTPEQEKRKTAIKIAGTIARFASGLYRNVQSQKDNYLENDGEWKNYIERCGKIITTLEKAIEYNPDEPQIYRTIHEIAYANLDGITCMVTKFNGSKKVTFKKTNFIAPDYKSYLEKKLEYYEGILKTKDTAYIQKIDAQRIAKKLDNEKKKLLSRCMVTSVIACGILGTIITAIINPAEIKKSFASVLFFSAAAGAGIGFVVYLVLSGKKNK